MSPGRETKAHALYFRTRQAPKDSVSHTFWTPGRSQETLWLTHWQQSICSSPWVTVMGNLLLSVASFSVTSVVNEARSS